MKLDDKTKKRTEVARKKAEELHKVKTRNELKIKEREMIKQIRQKEEEEQRRKNLEQKKKSILAKKNLEELIFKEKKEYAKIVKKQRSELDDIYKSYKDMIRKQKTKIKSGRISEVIQHKLKSETYANQFTTNLRQEYEDKISKEKEAYLELLKKKKQLEKHEAELIQNYTKTLNQEIETFKTLETVANIPLFHLGFRANNN